MGRWRVQSDMGTTSIDPGALYAAAQRLDAAADILAAALDVHLGALRSGGAGVERLKSDMRQWTRSASEVADALRIGAQRYVDGEAAAAAALQ